MPGPVQFNDQSRITAIKIHNILINDFLPQKANRIVPKKIIPKMSFLFGHIFAK